ncbi:hypothetical protein C7271_06260, partial [filamentous cyanobacterium CCP5]
ASALPQSVTNLEQPGFPWKHLALPAEVMQPLETLAAARNLTSPRLVLLSGPSGTGKTAIARALAHRWDVHLTRVDLGTLTATTIPAVLEELTSARGIVLLQTAQHWFGRHPKIDPAQVQDWLSRCPAELICLSTEHRQSVQPSWRRRCAGVFSLPRPDVAARRQILRQAVPAEVTIEKRLRWIQLARQLPLTGGELVQIAATAIALAQPSTSSPLGISHFQEATALRHPGLKFGSGFQKGA